MPPYLNFIWTFANSGGHTKSVPFLPVKLNTVSSYNFGWFPFVYTYFVLDFDSFGSRMGVYVRAVVSAIIRLQVFYFYIILKKICFFHHCCCIRLIEKSICCVSLPLVITTSRV